MSEWDSLKIDIRKKKKRMKALFYKNLLCSCRCLPQAPIRTEVLAKMDHVQYSNPCQDQLSQTKDDLMHFSGARCWVSAAADCVCVRSACREEPACLSALTHTQSCQTAQAGQGGCSAPALSLLGQHSSVYPVWELPQHIPSSSCKQGHGAALTGLKGGIWKMPRCEECCYNYKLHMPEHTAMCMKRAQSCSLKQTKERVLFTDSDCFPWLTNLNQ